MAQSPKGDGSRPGTSKQRRSARLGSAVRFRYVRTCPCGRSILCGGVPWCVGRGTTISQCQLINQSIGL